MPLAATAPPPSLLDSLVEFAGAYHRRADLVEEQRGWSRVIGLRAGDSGERLAIRVVEGRIVELIDRASPGLASAVDCHVEIAADAATLRDILTLRRSPNEPYLFGELTVEGAEADFVRLDYVMAALCG